MSRSASPGAPGRFRLPWAFSPRQKHGRHIRQGEELLVAGDDYGRGRADRDEQRDRDRRSDHDRHHRRAGQRHGGHGRNQHSSPLPAINTGLAMASQPAISWNVGGGSIGATGIFTAGTAAVGPFIMAAARVARAAPPASPSQALRARPSTASTTAAVRPARSAVQSYSGGLQLLDRHRRERRERGPCDGLPKRAVRQLSYPLWPHGRRLMVVRLQLGLIRSGGHPGAGCSTSPSMAPRS